MQYIDYFLEMTACRENAKCEMLRKKSANNLDICWLNTERELLNCRSQIMCTRMCGLRNERKNLPQVINRWQSVSCPQLHRNRRTLCCTIKCNKIRRNQINRQGAQPNLKELHIQTFASVGWPFSMLLSFNLMTLNSIVPLLWALAGSQ